MVLVHGAWHGAWCWEDVRQRLEDAGVPCVAVDNPSVVRAPSTLADDADNVTNTLDAIGGPVVLVGHSYGGAVVTDAGVHPLVEPVVRTPIGFMTAASARATPALRAELELAQDADWLRGL